MTATPKDGFEVQYSRFRRTFARKLDVTPHPLRLTPHRVSHGPVPLSYQCPLALATHLVKNKELVQVAWASS